MADSVLDETPTAGVGVQVDHGDDAPCHAGIQHLKQQGRWRGQTSETISVTLEVVTPIMGGSPTLRKVDRIDVIRGPSIRGHLRFWWRALNAHRPEYRDLKAFFAAERAIWGGAADTKVKGGRSTVDLQIQILDQAGTSRLIKGNNPPGNGAYATWPARATNPPMNLPIAERYDQGLKFKLELITVQSHMPEVLNALRAWILFGGYGGRTRRGLGSLGVNVADVTTRPTAATRESFKNLFGYDIFYAPVGFQPTDTPCIAGASLHLLAGSTGGTAERSWNDALGWLQEFRQGSRGGNASSAREAYNPRDDRRPSISNWPEADKVRRFSQPRDDLPWAHQPRHNVTPAWPRAGFGLPIVGKFQGKNRNNVRWEDVAGNKKTEPKPYQIRLIVNGSIKDRLASPLIVKALPLADGQFVACALWLNRAHPKGGSITLARPADHGVREVFRNENGNKIFPRASFDTLVATGDTARFPALKPHTTLRQAFLNWLATEKQTTVVAP